LLVTLLRDPALASIAAPRSSVRVDVRRAQSRQRHPCFDASASQNTQTKVLL